MQTKTGIAVALLLVLFSGPVLCNLLVCTAQPHHDCCPRQQTVTACPYDFLAHATGAVRVHRGIELAVISPVPAHSETLIPQAGYALSTVIADARNLHAIHSVLRI